MAYSFPEIKSFAGLFSQQNSFTVPDGALEVAENIVISRDGVLTKRRGVYTYYDPSSDTLNNLFLYQAKLIAVFSDKIGYFTDAGSSPNFTGTRTTLSGQTVAVTAGSRVSRGAESNKNFYFSTDNGVLKLEAFNSSIYTAGIPPALDLRAGFTAANGPIGGSTQVSWRTVFGRRDANDNLLLGVPSDILTLTNSQVADCAWTRAGAGPYTITITSTGHNLATGMTITGSGSSAASLNAVHTVTVTTVNAFTISVAVDPGAASGSDFDYITTRTTRLELSVPSEISSASDNYFFQVYRSSQSSSSAVSPVPDYKLIDERKLTSAEISNGVAFYTDDTDDVLLGAELYTNPNSREGETQGNDRPPLCDDITTFKNHMFYANCQTRHLIDLQVIDPSSLASADFVEIKTGSIQRKYYAKTGIGNAAVRPTAFSGTGTVTFTYASHGLVNGDVVYVSRITGTATEGLYVVSGVAGSNFNIAFGGVITCTDCDIQGVIDGTNGVVTGAAWTRTSNVVTVTSATHYLQVGSEISVSASSGGSPEVTSGVYTVLSVPTANTFTFASTGSDDASGNTLTYAPWYMFKLDNSSTSASVKLRETAQGLVKAINRDAASQVYAKYTSGIGEIPGKWRLQGKGFGSAIYLRANTTTAGGAFSPTFPDSYASGDQVYSRNDDQPNVVYSSKIGEPEAVPLVNTLAVGARNKGILRIVALRDSVIIFKEDGVFRINGDSTSSFSVTPIDSTVICVAASSVALLNNQALCLSNQGVVAASDTAIQVVSRKIEDPISAILGQSTLAAQTSSMAYESDRTYMLATLAPNQTSLSTVYVYNILNDTWTTSDALFTQGIVGPNDTMYLITGADVLVKERKNQSRIDYCGQNYSVTVVSTASDGLSGVVTSASAVPEEGDVIVKSDVFTRIKSVTAGAANQYTLVYERITNLVAADSATLYSMYTSTIKLAPFHAGLVGRMKQFAQMQIHLRGDGISRLSTTFAGNVYGGSEAHIWRSSVVAGTTGWGNEPWGFFPWGLQDGVNNSYGTQPAGIIRIYVPLFQQRNTFLQPVLEHSSAGEAINIQAICFAVRAYQERVSR